METIITKTKDKQRVLPLLRFPEFKDNWLIKRVDEITLRVSEAVQVEQETLYQQIGIRSHGKGIFHKKFVSGESLGNKRVFWVKKNMFIVNIVFAWEHAVAKSTEAEIGMIASHRFPMYKPVDKILDIDFLTRLFLTKKGKYLLGLASPGGAGRNKTLGQKTFNELKVNIPSLPEQKKIATFLSSIDQKIQELSRKKELLETYKKGLMQQLFSGELRFKDAEGKDYPDWEEKRLGEVCEVKGGKRIPKGNTLLEKNNGYPYITVSDIENYSISLKNIRYIPIEVTGAIKNYKITTDDIFISVAGTLGLIGIVPKLLNNANLTENCNKLTNLKCNQQYLLEFLKSDKLPKLIQNVRTVGAQPKLAIYALKALIVPLPNLEEQKKIAAFLTAVNKKIESITTQITKTQTFKKGLLQQLFV